MNDSEPSIGDAGRQDGVDADANAVRRLAAELEYFRHAGGDPLRLAMMIEALCAARAARVTLPKAVYPSRFEP